MFLVMLMICLTLEPVKGWCGQVRLANRARSAQKVLFSVCFKPITKFIKSNKTRDGPK